MYMTDKRTYQEYRRKDEPKVPRMLTTDHIYLCMSNICKLFDEKRVKRRVLKNSIKLKPSNAICDCRTKRGKYIYKIYFQV